MNFNNNVYYDMNSPIYDLINKQAKQLDETLCKFLQENGYKIDKPYNIKQLEEIRKDLERQDKFLNYIHYNEYSKDCSRVYYYIIPFFDRISNPLDEDYKQQLIEKFKKYHKGENDG